MKNTGNAIVLLCGLLLLGGCGNQEKDVQTELTEQEASVSQQEPEGSEQGAGVTEQEPDAPAQGQDAGEAVRKEEGIKAPAGTIVLELGADREISENGAMICTIHDFCLYDAAEEADVSQDHMKTIDAEDYMDRSKFLTIKVDINNINYPGDYEDGKTNVSMFTIEPKERGNDELWDGSYPVYVSEAGTGETDYYHVLIGQGETKTITLGFYVPVKDAEELRDQCRIAVGGSCYEIPEIQ